MVSTRSSSQKSTFFTPFNVKALSLNVPSSRTMTTSKRTVQTRRTSPRLQVKLKTSPAPKENVSCSAPVVRLVFTSSRSWSRFLQLVVD